MANQERAYRARTIFYEWAQTSGADGKTDNIYSPAAPGFTIDGVTFGSKLQAYIGVPTPAMLAHPQLAVMTVLKKPWPNSQMDRHTARPPEQAPERPDGLPRVGPGYMADLERRGLWPDARTLAVEEFVVAKIKNPGMVARSMLSKQGVRGGALDAAAARAELMASGHRQTAGIPTAAELAEAVADIEPEAKGRRKSA